MDARKAYLAAFAELEAAPSQAEWLQRLRRQAIDRFAVLGFPTTQLEDWKYTNVAPLTRQPFTTVHAYQRNGLTQDWLGQVTCAGADAIRLVLVDGHFAPDLSSLQPLPDGVRLTSLAQANGSMEAVAANLGHLAEDDENGFLALNTAFVRDGAFLHVLPGTVVETPIHLIFVSSAGAQPRVSHPRTLILLGAGAQATVAETYVGAGDGAYFTNAVTEIATGAGAVLEHCTVASQQAAAFHIASIALRQERDSNAALHSFALGGGLVRNDLAALIDGEGAECGLNGLYIGDGESHIDNHTTIEHLKPHGTSHELYRGVLGGKSEGVFNGRIRVRQDAQKTNARQTNNNLLLSPDAQINTKPQLEIYADDVKCNHGSTIGQLDPDAIFYLRARGLDDTAARAMLTYAFAGEMIERLRCQPLRQQLQNLVLARLPQRPRTEVSS